MMHCPGFLANFGGGWTSGRRPVLDIRAAACLGLLLLLISDHAALAQSPPAQGSLAASVSPTASSVDLSADGGDDWTHWGLTSTSSLNRKAGVTPQISDFLRLGSVPSRFQAPASVRATYRWNDGSPTASANTTAGLYFSGIGNGFELTVPADTAVRTLQVHLGGYQARGQLEIVLSDGSAAPFSTTVENLAGPFDRTVTVSYNATSAGQTLTLRYSLLSGSNVTLQAATLQGSPPEPEPQPELQFDAASLVFTADQGSGALQSRTVSLASSDGSAASFTLTASAGWLDVSPATGTTPAGTVTVTADPSGLPAGQYSGTVTATAPGFLEDSIAVTLTINSVGGSGSLAASVSPTGSTVDLSADGGDDWTHWGLTSTSSLNRKAGVTPQISDFLRLGSVPSRFQAPASVRATYRWNDGSPTASANTTAGLYFSGIGNGFELTVPADTAVRTLQVHLGGYQARGQLEIVLSDGSAAPFSTTVENLAGPFDRTVTVSYNATSAGQTLTLRYSLLSGSNVTLQAATLQGSPPEPEPQPELQFDAASLVFTADQGSGALQSRTVSLASSDGSAASFTLTASAGWLDVSPATGTTPAGTVTVTADPSGLPAGQYSGTVTATAPGFLEDSIAVTLTINSVGGSGSLAASVSPTGSTVDLSADGGDDWTHWGLTSTSSLNRKAGVTPQISDFLRLGSVPSRFQAPASVRATYRWNDGSPTASANTTAGLYFSGIGNGFELTVPADTAVRTLQVHLGGYRARGQLEIVLSDGSAAPFSTTVEDLAGPFDRTVTVSYNATSAGQTLTLRYTLLSGSNVTLQAATLQGSPPEPLVLPFADDFDDGARDGWAVVNETPSAANWSVVSGELNLSSIVESTNSFEESYHLGTYAWLSAGMALTDYSMSVQARRVNPERPESLGILFRYRDVDNFYRLTFNSRYGFARLEKREAGLYYTLGVSAIADDPSAAIAVNVDVQGAEIRVRLDGKKVFATRDSSHLAGSVGLFAQAQSAFDNVSITPVAANPDVTLASPVAGSVTPTGNVTATALVRGLPAGGSLELSLPGRPPVTLNAPPWQATYTGIAAGPTTVTATLRDSTGLAVAQHAVDFAVNGDYVLAIGDSITNGDGDTFSADNDDARRVLASRAYASTLAALMEGLPPTEIVVFNEGIGGDRTDETDNLRLQSILERHADAKSALVQLGTNDANAGRSVAAFTSNLQSIVSRLNAEGLATYVAKLPPFVGPTFTLASSQNVRVSQYNDAIDSNITGALSGPDFWAFFAPDDNNDGIADRLRTDLYDDPVHPNALGHSVIATLWYNALLGDATGTTINPFILDSISRPAYKQNLVEAGDEYLVDSAAVITSIPAALEAAVWVITAQADAASSESAFLSLDIDRNATVYVAYDADAASLPNWLNPASSAYSDTGLTLGSSASSYRVFSKQVAPGTEVLGGNLAAGAAGATDMYVVLVRPGS